MNLLTDLANQVALGTQRRGLGRVRAEPILEGLFCTLNGGPNGPQSIVQVEGDGADALKVNHVRREYSMRLPSRFAPEPPFRHGQAARPGVLFCNLGTPDAPTAPALRRYLAQFLSDPRVVEIPRWLWLMILHGIILRVRPAKSAKKYASIWLPEGSPLKVWTERQTQALQALFEAQGHDVLVRYAMTYGNPSIESQLDALKAQGVTRVLVLPAYPQYSGTTTAS